MSCHSIMLSSSSLKNLISLRARNISKRIKEALEELAENLENNLARNGNDQSHHARSPVPVPVPVRNNGGNRLGRFRAHDGNKLQTDCFGHCLFRRTFHVMTAALAATTRTRCGGSKVQISRIANLQSLRTSPATHTGVGTSRNFYTNNHQHLYTKYKMNLFRFYSAATRQTSLVGNIGAKHHQSWYRLKINHFYKPPSIITLLRQNLGLDSKWDQYKFKFNRLSAYEEAKKQQNPTTKSNLALNLSLTPQFHDTIMSLSRGGSRDEEIAQQEQLDVHKSCYIDFSINPKLLIPSSTILNEEILNELISNVKTFENTLIEIKSDLIKLSELGELPLKFISGENIIRVYFPNCDKDKLQTLLLEKSIVHGTIYEEILPDLVRSDSDSSFASDGLVPNDCISINEFDILSSFNTSSNSQQTSSGLNHHDVLSTEPSIEEEESLVSMGRPLSNDQIKRIETASMPHSESGSNWNDVIQINSVDDFYWT